ncbi:MAG: 50S ribosomal protein L29 [Patescibacteria group bacterium]
METGDLKNKNESDLQELLAQKRDLLRELRFKVSEKQLKDVREIREIKKDIARVLTFLRANKK